MAKGVVTITTYGPSGVARGDRISISRGLKLSSGTVDYWVVGRKSDTELIVASSWRESLWVLWFEVKAWFYGKWEAIRSRYRHDDEPDGDEDEDDRVIVAPRDSEDDLNGKPPIDPRMLN